MNGAAQSIDVDLSKAGQLGDELLERLDRLRDAEPIYWSETNNVWIITGHAEVVEALKGDLPFSNHRSHRAYQIFTPKERETRIPYMLETLPRWLIDLDPPEQPRLRRLMMKAFSRKIAEDLRPSARQFIAEAFDRAAGKQVEFVSEVARTIPSRVILKLMGLDDGLMDRAWSWLGKSGAALGGFGQTPELLDSFEATLLDMRSVFFAEIDKRRANPSDDFISNLITARDGEDRLSDEDILGVCYLTLLAGIDTTANTMAMGTAALARHPQARDFIRENPDQLPDILMELQRYIGMSGMQPRMIGEDFEWRGHQFKAGQFAMVAIAGANRDPSVFPEPQRLDFGRPQDGNMTFAPGLHFCIGHLLAKMQLSEFFPELVRRFDPQLLDARLEFQAGVAFRAIKSARVRLTPRLA